MKCRLSLFILAFLSLASLVKAENYTLKSYYPIPVSVYDQLHFVPQDALSTPCIPGTLSSLKDNPGPLLCAQNGVNTTWQHPDSIWAETLTTTLFLHYVYLSDTSNPTNLKFHIGRVDTLAAYINNLPKLTVDDYTKNDGNQDGGILAKGTFGDAKAAVLPAAGLNPGSYFIWYPKKAALRAGQVMATEWNDENIGNYSIAFGSSTLAAADYSTVSGGFNNSIPATGMWASIGGGQNNSAQYNASTIAGGTNNKITGNLTTEYSFIGGGDRNNITNQPDLGDNRCPFFGPAATATGSYSVIIGGQLNMTRDCYATIGGGQENFTEGPFATILGGYKNAIHYFESEGSVIGGGEENEIFGPDNSIGGGYQNKITFRPTDWVYYSSIGGGYKNWVDGNGPSVIVGGDQNEIHHRYAFIGGGSQNNVSGLNGAIVGGKSNTESSDYGFIGGGKANTVSGVYSVIFGGDTNTVSGQYSFIGGGQNNQAAGNKAVVAGGQGNHADGDYSWAGGNNMWVSGANTFAWGNKTTACADAGCKISQANSFIIFPKIAGYSDFVPGSVAFGTPTCMDLNSKLNVFGDNTSDAIAMKIAGSLYLTAPANISSGNFVSRMQATHIIAYHDLAETFQTTEDVTVGDVLVINPAVAQKLKKSDHPYDSKVVGVVSSAPAIRLDGSQAIFSPNDFFTKGQKPPVALAGQVLCKISLENGPIEYGDLLTTSSTPGYAMKATDEEKSFGSVVGKALEPFNGGAKGEKQGFITILVSLQ